MTNQKKAKPTVKRKVGRPTKYNPDFHPQDFIERSRNGENITEICEAWNLGRDQIYKWAERHEEFHYAIKIGRDYLDAFFHKVFKKMMYGEIEKANVTAAIFLSKNAVKWTDRIEEQTTINHITNLDFVDESEN